MNRFFFIVSSIVISSFITAQQQLPNSSFEDWEDVGTATMEPTHWSSLKTADAMASLTPEVLSRVAGRTGDWAIALEVKVAFSISANGMITNGRVHADFNPELGYVYTDVNDEKWNTPFSSRPDSIVGWYKYDPKNNDKGKIEVLLHKGSVGKLPVDQTTSENLVGTSRFDFVTAHSEWTRFSAPFNYVKEENSDYILVTIASGDSTISQAGTKLIVDDLELIYNQPDLGLNANNLKEIAINGSYGSLYFGVNDAEHNTYRVMDLTGKVIQEGKALPEVGFNHNSGIYIIQIETSNQVFTKKLYIQN